MLGTATKNEQDALIESMNEEIARLRGELARAAVREGKLREAGEQMLDAVDDGEGCLLVPRAAEVARFRNALATPSPLSDAIQKFLETAAWGVAQWRSRESEPRFILHQLEEASKPYRALLEGRGREED